MQLGEVLQAAALNRNSYNTMARRARLSFMAPLSEHRRAGRYKPWQAACLCAVIELQKGGLSLEDAAKAVSAIAAKIEEVFEKTTETDGPLLWITAIFRNGGDDPVFAATVNAFRFPDFQRDRYFVAVNLLPAMKEVRRRLAHIKQTAPAEAKDEGRGQ